jgi:hypothetical protein
MIVCHTSWCLWSRVWYLAMGPFQQLKISNANLWEVSKFGYRQNQELSCVKLYAIFTQNTISLLLIKLVNCRAVLYC